MLPLVSLKKSQRKKYHSNNDDIIAYILF